MDTQDASLADRFADIRARIARLPRVKLALTPTPLEEAKRLGARLGGPRVFVKRDDLTGIALGGNKTRNLEFRLARTLAEKPDTVIVGLDLQSNSARQTVGACNRLGLKSVLVLVGQKPNQVQGNLLVDYLLGAEVLFAADAKEQRRLMDERAAKLSAEGGRPHILNDNPMFDVASAVAYIECTIEILEQLAALGLEPDALYMSSAGKGQAGLVLAQKLFGGRFEVRGVTATHEHAVALRTAEIANRTAAALGLDDIRIEPDDIMNFGDFVGERYGVPNESGNAAVRLFAQSEGIILDPVYTGKCAAAMIRHIGEGAFRSDQVVVFVHTGGTPAIFTHAGLWL